MNNRYYVVAMDDSSRWGVPAKIIAQDKADCYFPNDEENNKKEFEVMLQWFDEGDYEFADWAKGNMDWDDVKEHAIRLPDKDKPKVDFQDCWVKGEYEYYFGTPSIYCDDEGSKEE